jgi:micrococcal nuclease
VKRPSKIPLLELLACATLVVAFCGLIAALPKGFAATTDVVSQSYSAPFQAKVIGVSDGDSITVRAGNETIRIRLAQIDAPERDQPWGHRSQQELMRLVGRKTILVSPQDSDRYGRSIANIKVDGLDVNQAMVKRGAAWAYIEYARDDTMAQLEGRARSSGQGLWAKTEDRPIAPWEYRRQSRDNGAITTAR